MQTVEITIAYIPATGKYGNGLDNKYLAPRLGNVEFNGSFTWV